MEPFLWDSTASYILFLKVKNQLRLDFQVRLGLSKFLSGPFRDAYCGQNPDKECTASWSAICTMKAKSLAVLGSNPCSSFEQNIFFNFTV